MLSFLFSIAMISAPSFAWQPAKDCRANIARVTCRVGPASRKCLGGEKVFADELVKVHDDLPPKLQKMFCHLRRIYIEEESTSSAYTTSFAEGSRLNGNVLGLDRKKVFESKYDLSEWLNRKEQTLFGKTMEEPLSPLIPVLEAQYTGVKARPLLIDIVIHEFGHMLENANKLVVTAVPHGEKCLQLHNEELPECRPMLTGLWPSISWLPDGSIRPEDRYFGDFRPCYYDCDQEQAAPIEKAGEIYRAFLEGNAFVSIYASVDPSEDFAESFLHYISAKYMSPDGQTRKLFYSSVIFPGEDPILFNSRAYHGRVLAKMNFMAMFDAMPWKYQVE